MNAVNSLIVTFLVSLLPCTCLAGSNQETIERRVNLFEYSFPLIKTQQALTDVSQVPDEALMIFYGAQLRYAFRTGDYNHVTQGEFLVVEAELEKRKLITRSRVSQIERGIVFVGMPLVQALASVDRLQEVDTLILEGSVIRSFRGPNFARLGSTISYDTFISCDGEVVTFFAASGLITKETNNRTIGSTRIRFQTNFPTGFWAEQNYEDRIRGNRLFKKPRYLADRREHRWSLFSNNGGGFMSPSVWYETGATSYRPTMRQVDINDMMRLHIRRGGSVCKKR